MNFPSAACRKRRGEDHRISKNKESTKHVSDSRYAPLTKRLINFHLHETFCKYRRTVYLKSHCDCGF